jgi:hypothetical protein
VQIKGVETIRYSSPYFNLTVGWLVTSKLGAIQPPQTSSLLTRALLWKKEIYKLLFLYAKVVQEKTGLFYEI